MAWAALLVVGLPAGDEASHRLIAELTRHNELLREQNACWRGAARTVGAITARPWAQG